ncbi:unnamed protein product [Brachionus calyciflorus]|uniref:G domain-containing protein n=1 Tax=Brachionus calyciflorus TaxID=104777 RepID=A0A814EG25_9BILA|nr:unnamed protein product [Brachionus calyciflorus]
MHENFSFRKVVVGNKPYAYVLNKSDLTDLTQKDRILSKLEKEGYAPTYFTNLRDSSDKTYRQILPNIISQIESQYRFNRELVTNFHLLVVGVPNVGKSTLINRLRNFHLKKGNAVKAGGEPGITRAVQSKVKINNNPLVYIYDTPGVLEPRFENIETGFKLACLNCVKNHQVNSDILADYLLYKLNKTKNFKYVEFYNLEVPSDNILEVLLHIAKSKSKIKQLKGFDNSNKKIYDIDAAGHMMIKHYFDGHLGKSMLDDDLITDLIQDDLNLEKFV